MWTFSRSFEVSEDLLNKSAVDLLIGGLDTVAEVSLNGQSARTAEDQDAAVILRSQNVHRQVTTAANRHAWQSC